MHIINSKETKISINGILKQWIQRNHIKLLIKLDKEKTEKETRNETNRKQLLDGRC